MVEGHERDSWAHTSHVLAYLATAFGGKAVRPDDLNPTKAMFPGVTSDDIQVVKSEFVRQAGGM